MVREYPHGLLHHGNRKCIRCNRVLIGIILFFPRRIMFSRRPEMKQKILHSLYLLLLLRHGHWRTCLKDYCYCFFVLWATLSTLHTSKYGQWNLPIPRNKVCLEDGRIGRWRSRCVRCISVRDGPYQRPIERRHRLWRECTHSMACKVKLVIPHAKLNSSQHTMS